MIGPASRGSRGRKAPPSDGSSGSKYRRTRSADGEPAVGPQPCLHSMGTSASQPRCALRTPSLYSGSDPRPPKDRWAGPTPHDGPARGTMADTRDESTPLHSRISPFDPRGRMGGRRAAAASVRVPTRLSGVKRSSRGRLASHPNSSTRTRKSTRSKRRGWSG